MNSTKRKGEYEMNYAVKLLRQILSKIIQNYESEDIFKSERHKKDYYFIYIIIILYLIKNMNFIIYLVK